MRVVQLCLALVLVLPQLLWAASAQYVNPGTAITFNDTTNGLTFASKATAAGHISTQVDLGDPHSPWYVLSCTFRTTSASTVGNRTEYYLAWSTGSHPDGEKGTASTALVANDVLNMKPALTVLADKTTGNTADVSGSALVNIPTQFVQVAYMNQQGVALSATSNISQCLLQPVPLEQQ